MKISSQVYFSVTKTKLELSNIFLIILCFFDVLLYKLIIFGQNKVKEINFNKNMRKISGNHMLNKVNKKRGVELVQVLCSCTIILYERYPFFFHQRVEKTPIDKPRIRVPLNFHVSFQIRVQYSPLTTKLIFFLNISAQIENFGA